jgi:hypothetical protein
MFSSLDCGFGSIFPLALKTAEIRIVRTKDCPGLSRNGMVWGSLSVPMYTGVEVIVRKSMTFEDALLIFMDEFHNKSGTGMIIRSA